MTVTSSLYCRCIHVTKSCAITYTDDIDAVVKSYRIGIQMATGISGISSLFNRYTISLPFGSTAVTIIIITRERESNCVCNIQVLKTESKEMFGNVLETILTFTLILVCDLR